MPCVAEYLFWSLQQYLPPANSSEVFACPHWELESLFLTLTVSFQRAHKQQKAMDMKALWGYAVQGGTASALRLGTLTCHPTFQCLPRSHHAARKPKIFGVNILYSGPTTIQRESCPASPTTTDLKNSGTIWLWIPKKVNTRVSQTRPTQIHEPKKPHKLKDGDYCWELRIGMWFVICYKPENELSAKMIQYKVKSWRPREQIPLPSSLIEWL